MTDTRADYDAELNICGEDYYFRRSQELLKRLEQRFGPLLTLAARVRAFSVTQAEMAGIYEEIVKGDPQRPLRPALERWVWEEGTPKLATPLAKVLMELPLGNTTLRLLEEEKRILAADQQEKAEAGRPTDPPGQGPAGTDLASTMAVLEQALQRIRQAA